MRVNADQRIDFADFQILELNFGQSAPAAAEPEPSNVLSRPATAGALFSVTPVGQSKPAPISRRAL